MTLKFPAVSVSLPPASTPGPFGELLRRAMEGERLLYIAFNHFEAASELHKYTEGVRPRTWHPMIGVDGIERGAFYVATVEDVDQGRVRGFRYDDWILGPDVVLTPQMRDDLLWGMHAAHPPAEPVDPEAAAFAARVRALRGQ